MRKKKRKKTLPKYCDKNKLCWQLAQRTYILYNIYNINRFLRNGNIDNNNVLIPVHETRLAVVGGIRRQTLPLGVNSIRHLHTFSFSVAFNDMRLAPFMSLTLHSECNNTYVVFVLHCFNTPLIYTSYKAGVT